MFRITEFKQILSFFVILNNSEESSQMFKGDSSPRVQNDRIVTLFIIVVVTP